MPPPLPPIPGSDFLSKTVRSSNCAVEQPEGDFTAEELQLERQVEQALNELEAADAAVEALQVQFENATEDVKDARSELIQLQSVAENWEKAAGSARQELKEKKQRIEDLLSVLPSDVRATIERPQDPTQEAAHRDCIEAKRLDLATQRIHVLEGQVARLEEQVAAQSGVVQERQNQRKNLEQQTEALEQERDQLRAAQRDARTAARAAESKVKARESAIAECADRRQSLERQMVQLQGEANGLRARLATATSMLQQLADTTRPDTPSTDVQPTGYTREDGVEVGPGEDARAVSLRLQREIVGLWEEIRQADEDALSMTHGPESHERHSTPGIMVK